MADWATVVSSFIAAIALVVAALEIASIRRRDREDQRVAIDGVSISWTVLEDQDHPDNAGNARPLYEFMIRNPGRLPIDNVKAVVQLGTIARRVRYSGNLGKPTETLTFNVPVLPGGGELIKQRRLELPYEARSSLRNMTATVTFHDMAMEERSNQWPRDGRKQESDTAEIQAGPFS